MNTILGMEDRDPADPRFTEIMIRKELIELGWHDRAIARMVAEKRWERVRQGAYVATAAWRLLDLAGRHEVRTRAVVKQSRTKLVVSHVSGVGLYDAPTWGLDLSAVHATREDGKAGRAEAGVCQHRGLIVPGDVVVRHGMKVMHASRLALEVTTVADTEPTVCVVNHLLHEGHTSQERIQERYASGIDFWPATLNTDVVIRLANALIESVGESRSWLMFFRAGLPMPIPQYEVRDGRGNFIGRVDFAWPELGVFLEFDGKVKYQKHLRDGESITDAVLREKRREERICEITGWRCIRITWADLDCPQGTVRRIQRLLAAGETGRSDATVAAGRHLGLMTNS
jgi:hypothetical protein